MLDTARLSCGQDAPPAALQPWTLHCRLPLQVDSLSQTSEVGSRLDGSPTLPLLLQVTAVLEVVVADAWLLEVV